MEKRCKEKLLPAWSFFTLPTCKGVIVFKRRSDHTRAHTRLVAKESACARAGKSGKGRKGGGLSFLVGNGEKGQKNQGPLTLLVVGGVRFKRGRYPSPASCFWRWIFLCAIKKTL
jgi:hypothetical protein